MFPNQLQLPTLLSLGVLVDATYKSIDADWADALSTADLHRLVHCCPALRELSVSLQPDAHVGPLDDLTGRYSWLRLCAWVGYC